LKLPNCQADSASIDMSDTLINGEKISYCRTTARQWGVTYYVLYSQPPSDLMRKKTIKLQQIVIYENPSAEGVAIMACGRGLS
jgi:hypothetical protein